MSARRKVAIFAAIGAVSAAAASCTQREARASAPTGPASPVVVELFTSEGCSSCPPADRVLANLETDAPPGTVVLPLAFHVDYWDSLGWPDPFAAARWTDRQRDYAATTGASGVYTPQMIVDGRAEFVGSDSSRADDEIAAASKRAKIAVAAGVRGEPTARVLSVTVGALATGDAASVVVALTDAHATVDVKRGENAGKKLEHTAIVRDLRVLGAAAASPTSFSIPIDPAWTKRRAVVFVQRKSDRAILGATSTTL